MRTYIRESMKSRMAFLILAFVIGLQTVSGGRITTATLPTMPLLPSRETTVSFRDKEGYMWYGVKGILCRDDGYEILTYPLEGVESIRDIREDKRRNLWLATDNGCFIFNLDSREIREFEPEKYSGNEVPMINFTKDGTIWISKRGVLSSYTPDEKLKKEYPIKDRGGNPTVVSGFTQGRNDDILITTYSRGIYRLNRQKDVFEMYAPIDKFVSLGIIFHDYANNFYWVADHQGMIYRFDPAAPEGMKYKETLDKVKENVNISRRVRFMLQDKITGTLWVATRSSILPLLPDSEGNLQLSNPGIIDYFNGAQISSIGISADKVWVFSYDKPATVIDLDGSYIENNRLQSVQDRYGDNPIILDLCEDPGSELLWMIQMGSGVLLYDRKTGRITDHDHPEFKGRRIHEAKSIAKSDYLHGIWVSVKKNRNIIGLTHDNAMNIHLKDSILFNSRIIPVNSVISKLYEDDRGRLWIGTSNGLVTYNLNKRAFEKKYPGIKNAKGFVRKGKCLWIIDNEALYEFKDDDKPRKTPLRGQFSSIALAPDGTVWVGTKDGLLYSYNPKDRSFASHGADLPHDNNEIIQLYVDKFSHLWIVTDQLVIQYNPRNKTHTDYQAGMPGRLNSYLTPNNILSGEEEIMVGGIGGISIFTPSNRLDVDIEEPVARITNVIVDGLQASEKGSGKFNGKKLVLDSDATNVEFRFSTLDQTNAPKERFAYRMKGVDKDWNYTKPGVNVAFYNTIPSGEHELEVKACDENNYWSKKSTKMTIVQKTPVLASWWAILIYIIIALAIIVFLLRLYLDRVNKKNEEMWTDSKEMVKMREYLQSPVTLPEEEFRQLDRVLLEKATKVVEKNIAEPEFGVNDLAIGVNMSKSSLARKLKAITGKTPLDFIRKIKMQYACRLLESQNHTVAEVAEMVGFEDRRYFTTSFKKEVGITPSAYVKGERPTDSKLEFQTDSQAKIAKNQTSDHDKGDEMLRGE